MLSMNTHIFITRAFLFIYETRNYVESIYKLYLLN